MIAHLGCKIDLYIWLIDKFFKIFDSKQLSFCNKSMHYMCLYLVFHVSEIHEQPKYSVFVFVIFSIMLTGINDLWKLF